MRATIYFLLIVFAICPQARAENLPLRDIAYASPNNTDAYKAQRCKLDILNIPSTCGFPTLVWFHGGGISAGDKKQMPQNLMGKSFAIVRPNYRLSPKIKAHEAIDDAAEAIAWVFNNIEKYGGDKAKIFVGGHSAGAYLSGMAAFAPSYLNKFGIKNTDIAGIVLLSGQTTTHFQVRKDLGDTSPQFLPKIDSLSLLGTSANKVSPVCIIVGDRRLEFKERVEENFLLEACLRTLKSSSIVEIYELQGLNHGTVANGVGPIADSFIKRVVKSQKKSAK